MSGAIRLPSQHIGGFITLYFCPDFPYIRQGVTEPVYVYMYRRFVFASLPMNTRAIDIICIRLVRENVGNIFLSQSQPPAAEETVMLV